MISRQRSDGRTAGISRYVDARRFDAYDENVYVYTGEVPPWTGYYYTNLPIDAQSGEAILFTTGDAETFSVPELVTWDEL